MPRLNARQDVLDEMNVFVHEAKRRENALLTRRSSTPPIKRRR